MRAGRRRTTAAAAALALGLLAAVAPHASAAITSGSSADALASAITGHQSWIVPPSSFVSGDPNSLAVAVADNGTTLGGLPRPRTSDFAILSTGDTNEASMVALPATDPGTDLLKGSVRGGWDRDATILKIDLNLPVGTNCLTFDFRFFSDEWDQVARGFNDAFVSELDANTWTTTNTDKGIRVISKRNFALDPDGGPITAHKVGIARWMTAEDADGTSYNGATPLLRAATPVGPGKHTLYLSIFDLGDALYDSAVILDNMQARRNTTRCVSGVAPLPQA